MAGPSPRLDDLFADARGTDGSQFFPPEQMKAFLAKDQEVFECGRQIEFEDRAWNAKLEEDRIAHAIKKPICEARHPRGLAGLD